MIKTVEIKQKTAFLPNIRQSFCKEVAKSVNTGLWYPMEDGKVLIDLSKDDNHLIGLDQSKYERNEAADSIGFHAYKIKA